MAATSTTTGEGAPVNRNWGCVIGIFVLVAGLLFFGAQIANIGQGATDLVRSRATTFFDDLRAGRHVAAYEVMSSEWQERLGEPGGLTALIENEFTLPDSIAFSGVLRQCRTERMAGGRTLQEGSQAFGWHHGSAEVGGERVEMTIRFHYDRDAWRILGVSFGEKRIGADIPEGCRSL